MTMIALYYWPSPRTPPSTRRELRIALIFAALGCIFRPTNAILWVYMGGQLLAIYPHRSRPIIYDTIVTAFFALCVSLCMDRLFYKRWVFTQWEFFRINVFEGISEFYGTHPFHWYFTQGLPLVLFTSLPFCLYGGMTKFKQAHKQQLFSMCIFTILALSIQAHKEFRFLLPLVAPMQIFAGRQLHFIAKEDVKKGRTGSKSRLTQYLALIIVTNCIMGFYFSRIHKRGVVHAVEWLRERAYAQRVTDILFLMPCHSTPYYSHIHLDIPIRFITCEPPLGYGFNVISCFTSHFFGFVDFHEIFEASTRMKQICSTVLLQRFLTRTFQSKLETSRCQGRQVAQYTPETSFTRFLVKDMQSSNTIGHRTWFGTIIQNLAYISSKS